MRYALLLLLTTGCTAPVCDAFPGESCIALHVTGDVGRLDRLRVTAELASGIVREGTTPLEPKPFSLPVDVALRLGTYTGGVVVQPKGRLGADGPLKLGLASVVMLDRVGEHPSITIELRATGADGGVPADGGDVDAASLDAAGVDAAGPGH